MVRIPAFHAGGPGSIPGVGMERSFREQRGLAVKRPGYHDQEARGLNPTAVHVGKE